jgi:hypothetical protein
VARDSLKKSQLVKGWNPTRHDPQRLAQLIHADN